MASVTGGRASRRGEGDDRRARTAHHHAEGAGLGPAARASA